MKTPSTPYMPNRFATASVALSAIIMAYGSLLGFLSILVFYALWLPRIMYKGRLTLYPTRDVAAVMLFPSLALISTLWSAFPRATLYNAGEYFSLIVCTVIIAKTVSTEAFMRGIAIGSTLVLLASIASGNYDTDPSNGNYALTGLFGSKNQVGLFAEIGLFTALLNSFRRDGMSRRLLYGYLPFAVCCIGLYLSRSASSILSLGMTFGVVMTAYIITWLFRRHRLAIFALGLIGCVAFVATAVAFDWHNALFKSFGKDSTLTGRTYLWDKGIAAGWEAPLLGHGYSAFWVPGNPGAEQIWYDFGIAGRSGFHFHNLYVELFVENGWLGLLVMGWLIARSCSRSIALALANNMRIEYVFALGIAIMFLIRSFVEVDFIGTFSISPILVFSILPRLATYQKQR